MTNGHRHASQQLTAIVTSLADRDITVRLTHIGGTPVLTAQNSVPGNEPVTVSVDPDTSQPGLPLECTCIWTTAPPPPPEPLPTPSPPS